MTYSPKRAPRHRTYHRRWPYAHITNSERGSILARDEGKGWVDNDFHLTRRGVRWVNAHGAPERFWLPKGVRFEQLDADDARLARGRTDRGHTYHLRDEREAFTDNHHHGIKTEAEVKDVRPWATPEILDAAFARMAASARVVYGPEWRKHVVVKVLTNLHGGIPYALDICRAAHKHDIPTMLLARGRARFQRFRGRTAVTWVRGSAVIR